MTGSYIAIRGDFFDKAGEVFQPFKLIDTKQDQSFDNWQQFNDYLVSNYQDFAENDIAIRGLWVDNNWTIINDPEMVDTVDEEALLKLSEKINAQIITFVIQTTSNSFGFTVYNSNTIKRNFFASNGEVLDNILEPMLEEADLNISATIFADDILNLASKLGINLDGKTGVTYTVKQLAYNDELKAELKTFKQQPEQADTTSKPWWKVW